MGTRREKILQKLNPNLLKMTPKLSGDAGSFIDLDSDNAPEDGVKNLMMRFFRNQDLCEKNKRNVQNETELTVSSVKRDENNEICLLMSEKLTLPFVRNDEDDVSDRPGKRLQKLKMELQEKMSAKWEEEYKKRVSEKKLYSEIGHKQKKYSEDDIDKNDDEGVDNGDNNSDNEKNFGAECDEEKGVTKEIDGEDNSDDEFGDDEKEADGEENSDDEFGDDEEESDGISVASDEHNNDHNCKDNDENKPEEDDEYHLSDGCSLVPAYQPGGGMLYGGSELTQSDEGLPRSLISPSLRLSMNESSELRLSLEDLNETTPKKAGASPSEVPNAFAEKYKLFSQVPNDSFELNEAFELCSGKFPDPEESGLQLATQNVVEENLQDSDDDDDDDDKSSSSLEKSQSNDVDTEKEISKSRRNIIVFDDSDAEEEHETENDINTGDTEDLHSTNPKLLSDNEDEVAVDEQIKKKKKKRMNLHFSDDEEDAIEDCEKEKGNESDDPDVADVSEQEDEDDEQRSVHYDSEENEIINPKEFFEKEAELSGSEWSGDEDERGLDKFDVEEGDADQLDNNEVRSQLEKIHIRRLLDDDAREVRLIQEILFEDGDLHSDGKKRDRKFRWKNLGTFDDEGNEGKPQEEGGNSGEDDGTEEAQLWKIRHEKEMFLKTRKKDGDLSSDEEIVEDFNAIKATSAKAFIKLSSNGENASESSKNITDSCKTATSTGIPKNVRGSFLARNEQFLSRLAKATSNVTDNVLGPKSSKNFVFATRSPEKVNPNRNTVKKRQMEDSGSCGGRDKRIRNFMEIETGPSILDFLV